MKHKCVYKTVPQKRLANVFIVEKKEVYVAENMEDWTARGLFLSKYFFI